MSLSDVLLLSSRDKLRIGALVAVLVAACLWVSFLFLEPIPPRRIVLASGPQSGLYHQMAQRYAELLAREGVTVEERMTEGAGENLRLLLDKESGVDIAFVQGGVAKFPEANSLVMVASLYYEPLWIFVRRGERIDALAQLAGKRVAMGVPGSGTFALAEQLLAASSVTPANATLLRMPPSEAQDALKTHHIDAMLIVGGVRAPAIRAALIDPALELVSLAQADAYPPRYPFLTRRTLAAGTIAFVPLIPPQILVDGQPVPGLEVSIMDQSIWFDFDRLLPGTRIDILKDIRWLGVDANGHAIWPGGLIEISEHPTVVPEPATLGLLALGGSLTTLLFRRRPARFAEGSRG